MKFYLGTHRPHWLGGIPDLPMEIPLFVSRRTLAPRKTLPRAVTSWALDSGGFTELNTNGEWSVTPKQYAREVRRFYDEVGRMEFAASMDYMVEPFILEKTGLTLGEHQRRTVENYVELVGLAPDLPWMPVLQGWHLDDYRRCVDLYENRGVDLKALPRVGVGSVCRRQKTNEIVGLVKGIAQYGFSLHLFGVKLTGLPKVGHLAVSADSMAWCYRARKGKIQLPECTADFARDNKAGHKNCANCPRWATIWYGQVMDIVKKLPRENR